MEILVLFFVMLVIVVVQSWIFGKQCFKKFDYQCYFDRAEAFEGDSIGMVEVIANRKWLPLPWLKSEITTSKWLDFAGSQSVVTYNSRFVPSFFLVKSHQKITRRWNVRCLKRGVFHLESVILVSTDLMGRKNISKPVKTVSSVMVLPQTVDLSALLVSARYLQGDYPVRNQLIPDPFYVSGVREYRPGDPMKNIHWNATAKLGRIMMRNLEFTTRQSLTVILNTQTREYELEETIDEENLEMCIRVAASLLDNTIEGSIPVCLAVNTSLDRERNKTMESDLQFGREHVLSLFRLLAQLPFWSSQILSAYLETNRERFDTTDFAIVTSYLNEAVFDFCREKSAEGKQARILMVGEPEGVIPDDCDVYLLRSHLDQWVKGKALREGAAS